MKKKKWLVIVPAALLALWGLTYTISEFFDACRGMGRILAEEQIRKEQQERAKQREVEVLKIRLRRLEEEREEESNPQRNAQAQQSWP